ncbi:MAG: LysM peptidoglycan-binding domain-containing protein [Planctomycetia bacterium]|nr:MAG: LysM peptidoglycan-binding domain-containing protein [Planctomycetia bacterium]
MATRYPFRFSRSRVSTAVGAVWCAAMWITLSGCPAPERTTSQPAASDEVDARSATLGGSDEAADYVQPGEVPGRVHIVEPGDTLYSLAVRYYGSGLKYNRILVANRNRLKDPRNLPVGMKLIIP